MIPLYATNGEPATAVLGLPMCQNRLAVPTWSYAMEVDRPARVVEIGSYSGGLAIALGVHCWMIGAHMVSYDRNAQDARLMPLARALNVDFRVGDCWDLAGEIGALISAPGRTFVLCDGGDKPRELMVFGQFLKSGDVIAAHDYDAYQGTDVPEIERPWPWQETTLEDGNRAAERHNLVPYMQKHFDFAGWLAFQKP